MFRAQLNSHFQGQIQSFNYILVIITKVFYNSEKDNLRIFLSKFVAKTSRFIELAQTWKRERRRGERDNASGCRTAYPDWEIISGFRDKILKKNTIKQKLEHSWTIATQV